MPTTIAEEDFNHRELFDPAYGYENTPLSPVAGATGWLWGGYLYNYELGPDGDGNGATFPNFTRFLPSNDQDELSHIRVTYTLRWGAGATNTSADRVILGARGNGNQNSGDGYWLHLKPVGVLELKQVSTAGGEITLGTASNLSLTHGDGTEQDLELSLEIEDIGGIPNLTARVNGVLVEWDDGLGGVLAQPYADNDGNARPTSAGNNFVFIESNHGGGGPHSEMLHLTVDDMSSGAPVASGAGAKTQLLFF